MEVLSLQNNRSAHFQGMVFKLIAYSMPTAEEKALIKFFGDDYETYRRNVGTKIPFIP